MAFKGMPLTSQRHENMEDHLLIDTGTSICLSKKSSWEGDYLRDGIIVSNTLS